MQRWVPWLSARRLLSNGTKPVKEWKLRQQLRVPILQRDEMIPAKVHYQPRWNAEAAEDDDQYARPYDPLRSFGMTPTKWEFYNKTVWPPNYVVPETGLPKAKEVFHCRQSVHFSPKRAWQSAQLIWRMNVDEAILQLNLQQIKGCVIWAEVLDEAKKRASDEFHIEYPSKMHVAEAFAIQSHIIKGARRHAHENWCTIRYRYINMFVRLEEGDPPGFKSRLAPSDGWDKMRDYYEYLRSRQIKYSIG